MSQGAIYFVFIQNILDEKFGDRVAKHELIRQRKRLGKLTNKENHLPNSSLDLQRGLPYMRPYAGMSTLEPPHVLDGTHIS